MVLQSLQAPFASILPSAEEERGRGGSSREQSSFTSLCSTPTRPPDKRSLAPHFESPTSEPELSGLSLFHSSRLFALTRYFALSTRLGTNFWSTTLLKPVRRRTAQKAPRRTGGVTQTSVAEGQSLWGSSSADHGYSLYCSLLPAPSPAAEVGKRSGAGGLTHGRQS